MPTLVKEGEEEHNKMEDVDWFIFFKKFNYNLLLNCNWNKFRIIWNL
jgi:hypothetical protein